MTKTRLYIDVTNYEQYGKCIITCSEVPESAIKALKIGRITMQQMFKICPIVVSMDIGIHKEIFENEKKTRVAEIKKLYAMAKRVYQGTEHKVRLTYIKKRKYE